MEFNNKIIKVYPPRDAMIDVSVWINLTDSQVESLRTYFNNNGYHLDNDVCWDDGHLYYTIEYGNRLGIGTDILKVSW
jgi:hypothetical protein